MPIDGKSSDVRNISGSLWVIAPRKQPGPLLSLQIFGRPKHLPASGALKGAGKRGLVVDSNRLWRRDRIESCVQSERFSRMKIKQSDR
jgi:hypothetical protein